MAARVIGKLSNMAVRNAKPPRGRSSTFIGDGGGLYLQATLGGDGTIRKSWVFRFQRSGKRHEMGLGALHTIGLAEARSKARTLRQQILDGVNPLEHQRKAHRDRRLADTKALTFGQCVDGFLADHKAGWRSAKHPIDVRKTLTGYCAAILDMPVQDIGTDHVIAILSPIWTTKTQTAKRLRGRIERVLARAKSRGLRSGENPATWRNHLDTVLPSPARVRKVQHHPSLPYADAPDFMARLRALDRSTARALEFLILTATRTQETLGARWAEIDLPAKTWIVPASRTKTGVEHRVPLSDRAIEILNSLPRISGGDLVFAPHGRRISGMVLPRIAKAICDGITLHGFRSTFRTWAGETTGFPFEICEAAIGHRVSRETVRAYARTDFFERRRVLMADWADYCTKPAPAGETVITLRRKARANA